MLSLNAHGGAISFGQIPYHKDQIHYYGHRGFDIIQCYYYVKYSRVGQWFTVTIATLYNSYHINILFCTSEYVMAQFKICDPFQNGKF